MYYGALRFVATCVGPLLVYVLTINSYSSIHVAQTSTENEITIRHSELPAFIFCVGYPCLKNPSEETKKVVNMKFWVLNSMIVSFITTKKFLACDVVL